MLDYGKDCFRRVCKRIKIKKNLFLYLSSGGHGDRSARLFDSHKAFTTVNEH